MNPPFLHSPRSTSKGHQTVDGLPQHAPASRPAAPHWHDAVTELVELQAVYAAWLEALPRTRFETPDTLRGTPTAFRPSSMFISAR
jgi:hypothetical protein